MSARAHLRLPYRSLVLSMALCLLASMGPAVPANAVSAASSAAVEDGLIVPGAVTPDATLKTYALGLTNNYMKQFSKTGFGKSVTLGNPTAYKDALNRVKLVFDKKFTKLAEFDPKTNTITLSFDPSKVKAKDRLNRGQSVWHELTHKIEAIHGDSSVIKNEPWEERNVDYMTNVTDVALSPLLVMERLAGDKDATDEQIMSKWKAFQKVRESSATDLASTRKYPADLELMKKWFGFEVTPDEIANVYAAGRSGLGTRASARLRELFRARLDPRLLNGNWTGTRSPEHWSSKRTTFCLQIALTPDYEGSFDAKGTFTLDEWGLDNRPAATYVDGILRVHRRVESTHSWTEWTVAGTAAPYKDGYVMNGTYLERGWWDPAIWTVTGGEYTYSAVWSVTLNRPEPYCYW
jgi:hypothetical protein